MTRLLRSTLERPRAYLDTLRRYSTVRSLHVLTALIFCPYDIGAKLLKCRQSAPLPSPHIRYPERPDPGFLGLDIASGRSLPQDLFTPEAHAAPVHFSSESVVILVGFLNNACAPYKHLLLQGFHRTHPTMPTHLPRYAGMFIVHMPAVPSGNNRLPGRQCLSSQVFPAWPGLTIANVG